MTPESATEWYQFICSRCAKQWAVRYEVRSVTDDAGQTRRFYTCHELPCEAPSHAQAICPTCGHAPVHAKLLSGTPDQDLSAVPLPGSGAQPVLPHRHGVLHAWRRFTFEAIISLDEADATGGWPRPRPAGEYLPQTRSLMVHVPYQGLPGKGEYLPAIITRQDEQPLRPGDSHVTVTISVADDEVSGVLAPGHHFALWAGDDIGHGTVLRRVLFD